MWVTVWLEGGPTSTIVPLTRPWRVPSLPFLGHLYTVIVLFFHVLVNSVLIYVDRTQTEVKGLRVSRVRRDPTSSRELFSRGTRV